MTPATRNQSTLSLFESLKRTVAWPSGKENNAETNMKVAMIVVDSSDKNDKQ